MPKTIKCSKCEKEHEPSTCNCCWIYCDCGNQICGACGSTKLGDMDPYPDDDESEYWCCKECKECGLTGCAMCI